MKQPGGAAARLILLAFVITLITAGCGDSPTATAVPATATPPPPTATALPPTAPPAPAPTVRPTVGNPIIATITAGAGNQSASGTPAATTAAAPNPTVATIPESTLPVYSGLRKVNLGVFGTQITTPLTQASTGAKSSFYVTADSFDKLAAFYNPEMARLSFTKVAEQSLPANVGVNGNVLLYSKGSGTAAQVATVMYLGPLDAGLISSFNMAAPGSNFQPGDNLVILIDGLTGQNLVQLQNTLRSGGASSTPAPSPTP